MMPSPPERILVICTRRLGDVLLATPVIHSCRQAYPEACIDALVFDNTAGMLEGNSDLSHIIPVPVRSSWAARLNELRRLWRKYDLALSVTPSDRARIYGWAAGRIHYGTSLADEAKCKHAWMSGYAPFDDVGTHTVSMNLRVASLAEITPIPRVIPPSAGGELPEGTSTPFAILHPHPQFNYKMWRDDGWIGLAHLLRKRNLQIILTGGPGEEERAACDRISAATEARNLSGRLTLSQTADLLRHASLYVGPDTAMTHLAAALEVPTIALFGPSNPVKWGPWPSDWVTLDSPWQLKGGGRHGNVYLLQGSGECVPCRLEGCDRHPRSYSRCLQEITLGRVLRAVDTMLTQEDADFQAAPAAGGFGVEDLHAVPSANCIR
jgi:heptosyltransferase-3